MKDDLTTQDALIGGVAFIAGILTAGLFGTRAAAGGCGCGKHTVTPALLRPAGPSDDADRRFQNAKQVAPYTSGPGYINRWLEPVPLPIGNLRG